MHSSRNGAELLQRLSEKAGDNGYLTLWDISYAMDKTADSEPVAAVAQLLGAAGIRVFMDEEAAAGYFLRAAGQGDSDAMLMLGKMYRYGTGVRKDGEESLKWYRSAAEQGSMEARSLLGDIYRYGKGVAGKPDLTEALRWYTMAAEQGDAGAQRSLGEMYFGGCGVRQDYAEAAKWLGIDRKSVV